MKNQYLTSFFFLLFILNSCQSKPEVKQKPIINYTIQNYKLDDDEMEKRRLADSLAKETHSIKQKTDSLQTNNQ